MFPALTKKQTPSLKTTRSCSPGSDVSSSCIEVDATRAIDSKGLNDALGLADLSDGSTVGRWTHSIESDSNPTGEQGTDSEGSSHSFSPSVLQPLHYKVDRKSYRRPSRSEEREYSRLVKHQSTDEDYTFSSPRRKHSNALINIQSYSLCNSESHSSCK
ncbi:UNVERIFIED_CONTAM: hypothetical protein FKN15_073873 [Acipenser sinensis]